MSAHPLPLDSGESSRPEAGGFTPPSRDQRPHMRFRVSGATMDAAVALAKSAGMSYQTWARMVIEQAVSDASRGGL